MKTSLGRLAAPIALTAILTLGVAACGSSSSTKANAPAGTSTAASKAAPAGTAKGVVKVGAFRFPEGTLVANIYAAALKKAGYDASVVQLDQRETAEPLLQQGDVTMLPEYVSSMLDFFKASTATSDPAANVTALTPLAAAKGVTITTPSPATDNYAYSTDTAFATKNNIKTLSDLAAYSKKTPITLAGTPECKARTYCYVGLMKTYGMKFGGYKVTVLSSQASVDLLLKGTAQLLESNSSDGVLSANPVTVLTDDKGLNHQDNIVPAVNTKALTPDLTTELNKISAALTQDVLNAGNKAVQIDRTPAAAAAQTIADKIG